MAWPSADELTDLSTLSKSQLISRCIDLSDAVNALTARAESAEAALEALRSRIREFLETNGAA